MAWIIGCDQYDERFKLVCNRRRSNQERSWSPAWKTREPLLRRGETRARSTTPAQRSSKPPDNAELGGKRTGGNKAAAARRKAPKNERSGRQWAIGGAKRKGQGAVKRGHLEVWVRSPTDPSLPRNLDGEKISETRRWQVIRKRCRCACAGKARTVPTEYLCIPSICIDDEPSF